MKSDGDAVLQVGTVPHVGHVVLYCRVGRRTEVCPAIITRLNADQSVNATVFMDGGRTYPVFNIVCVEPAVYPDVPTYSPKGLQRD